MKLLRKALRLPDIDDAEAKNVETLKKLDETVMRLKTYPDSDDVIGEIVYGPNGSAKISNSN